jgi:hypothetical protein
MDAMLVELTTDELDIINNALNEVCNGIDLEGEEELRYGNRCRVQAALDHRRTIQP